MIFNFVKKVLHEDTNCSSVEWRVSGTGTVNHEISDCNLDVSWEVTSECIILCFCQCTLDRVQILVVLDAEEGQYVAPNSSLNSVR